MCGIAGIVSPHHSFVQQNKLQQMNDTLFQRGPDGEGYWINENKNIGFAHRRLSIIDLSPKAVQPLHSIDYTIMLNGEIYNYIELRKELTQKGYSFKTETDTEIIPAAYDAWGIDCLQKFDGMFVFVLYNKKNQKIIIARDRFGEKPLYYHAEYLQRGRFEYVVFASEMKAIWAYGIPRKLNGTAMLNYLGPGLLQNPEKKAATFFSNILSLPPAHYLEISASEGRVQMKRWYKLDDSSLFTDDSEEKYLEKFKELFFLSTERRLRSDVKIGTSLSGGIDSSAVLAAIHSAKQKNNFTKQWSNLAFTAVFPGFEKDESEWSKKVAAHFNIEQHTVSPNENDLHTHWQNFMHHQEQPVQSSSVFTQYFVYKLAKENAVTVLLDGQGADEILAGYAKFAHYYLQHLVRNDYRMFRHEKHLLIKHNFLKEWGLKNYAAAYFPGKASAYLQQKAFNQIKNHPYINKEFAAAYSNFDTLKKPLLIKLEDALYYSTFTLGLEELLRYADRNSMAHSVEVRLPFLFHELVEFIFSLPSSYKIKNGFTKWILRQSMQNMLPVEIQWRTGKIGYEPPQQQWMQDKSIKEIIMESRSSLIKHKVLNETVMNAPISASGAHEQNNNDWRYMNAAALF